MMPTSVAEASMDDSSYGAEQAKMNAQGIRKSIKFNDNTALILITHTAPGIGKYASKELKGGRAQEDFASMMLWVARGPALKEAEKKIGYTLRVTVEKDKIGGHQYDSCEVPFIYDGGVIDTIGGLIAICVDNEAITRINRLTYDVLGTPVQGKEGLRKYLEDNPEVCEALRKKLNDG
jgi:RecA/RadA recombinase